MIAHNQWCMPSDWLIPYSVGSTRPANVQEIVFLSGDFFLSLLLTTRSSGTRQGSSQLIILWAAIKSIHGRNSLVTQVLLRKPWKTLADMGFLNSCWQNLLKLSSYAYMVDYNHGQKPLPLPTHSAVYPGAATQGVSFTPQGASPDFQCKYPSLTGWNYCGNASDRRCWLDDPSRAEKIHQYNITTDYEAYSPPGVTREYWLNVSVSPISPDGYVKPLGQVFNNSYPGPILQACWGDEMIVHVTNLDDKNGHTTHWHGLRQHGTNQMDGVNGKDSITIRSTTRTNTCGKVSPSAQLHKTIPLLIGSRLGNTVTHGNLST